MDATMARQQLRELNESLAKVDEEREVLLSLIKGYEGWLRLHGRKATDETPPSLVAVPRPRQRPPTAPPRTLKGSISLRKAVLQVLREAHGEPVRVGEILARATAMGAITNAKSPDKIIDLVAYNLKTRSDQPIERVSPRSWRWKGD